MATEQTREISDGMLAVHVAQDGVVCRIGLRGELDLANAGTAEAELDAALESGAPVVVDMRQLEFIDSTGIALLVRAMQVDGNASGLSFLRSEFDAVNRVLELTGVGERMALADERSTPAA
jgi:anti-anti-sigma factor